jgi:hypothetical protein
VKLVQAPWDSTTLQNLNEYQRWSGMHPYTCDAAHDGDHVLVAETDGWHCPGCPRRQEWVLDYMAEGRWRHSDVYW